MIFAAIVQNSETKTTFGSSRLS